MKHPILLAGLALALCACSTQSPIIDTSTPPDTMGKRIPVEWSARNTGEDANGIPQNTLTLNVMNDTRDELYKTECVGTTLVQGVTDLDGSVAYIQCWWAGGGDQFAVFTGEGEAMTVRHRTVDEESGFGEWEDLKVL